jgi:hypothetical protein
MKRIWIAVVAAAVGAAAWSMTVHPWGWLYGIGVHPYPSSSDTPWTYQLLSGFIPALTVVGLSTLIVGGWHHINCHEDGCWRIGKHKVEGSPWCSAHHEAARTRAASQVTLDKISGQLDTIITLMRKP